MARSSSEGIEEAARLKGLAVGVRVVESDRTGDVRHAVDYLSDPSAGGVIVVAFDAAGAGVLRALPADVAAVAATEAGGLADTARTMLYLDERQAAAEATRHLLALGHHGAPRRDPLGDRYERAPGGWRDALAAAGAVVPPIKDLRRDQGQKHVVRSLHHVLLSLIGVDVLDRRGV